MPAEYDDGGYDRNRSYGRGRGRGRGRSSRGRGRGGYNGPQDVQQDGGFYNQEAPMQGRGRALLPFHNLCLFYGLFCIFSLGALLLIPNCPSLPF